MTRWNAETAQAYGSLGEQGHVDLIQRRMGELLGDLRGARVLDFGCGPGRLSAALAEAGAASVVGMDQSREMIEAARRATDAHPARAESRLTFEIGDERQLPPAMPFDAALCCLVMMMCESRERLDAVARALVQSVRPGGRIGVVLTHPCFRSAAYPTFRYRMPPGYSYWKAGAPYEVIITADAEAGGAPDAQANIVDHHWTVGDYVNAIGRAGGCVRQVDEWPAAYDSAGEPVGDPAYFAISAVRMNANANGLDTCG